MALEVGSRLGHYDVTALIGEGGMGQVYRATDTQLGRDVALKILPDAFAADPDRLARFQREARVLASLNHPNIAQIHGIEKSDDTQALVLELVEGPTLAARIAQGPIPLDEALPIAKQIAEALEAAHEAGVIHRDLKPANIKVREDGTVKVLDFGLAKAMDTTPAGDPSQSPTLTAAATQMGVIMGTAAYMSPEQARGKPVDKRADIWAFGAVLYEMLASARAFPGQDTTDTIAAVVRAEPDWSTLSATPRGVVELIRRCLLKDPRRRLRDIGDARFALDTVGSTDVEPSRPQASRAAAAPATMGRPLLIALGAFVLGGALVGLLSGVTSTARPAAEEVTRLSITPSLDNAVAATGYSRDLAITPDGRRVVYIGGNGTALFVRTLGEVEPIRIDDVGMVHHPFISPDGAWIGFVDGASWLKRVPITGGPVETVCRIVGVGITATWATQDEIIVDMQGTLWRVPARGGQPERFVAPDQESESVRYSQPSYLADARLLLISVFSRDAPPRIGALDPTTGRVQVLDIEGRRPRYLASGHLMYEREDALRVVPFDVKTLTPRGPAVAVDEPILFTPFGRLPAFDVSRNGTLVYFPSGSEVGARALVWVDRNGRETRVDLPPRAYTYPRVSPSGDRVALDIRDEDQDIWVWDLGRSGLRRITFGRGRDQFPVWTPDERYLVSNTGGGRILRQRTDGTGAQEELITSDDLIFSNSVSPDGTFLTFRQDSRTNGHDVMVLSFDGGGPPRPLIQSGADELNAEISPDGRWVAFQSNESGRYEIYVRPFPDADAGRWQVSHDGGREPLWSRDGAELFFVSPRGTLMAAEAEPGDTAFAAGEETELFGGRFFVSNSINLGRTYDVSTDGKRFLMIKPEVGAPPSLSVTQDWFRELARLAPADE